MFNSFNAFSDLVRSVTPRLWFSDSLKTHMRTHTMQMPFICEKCGSAYSLKSNLKQHMKTHEEKSFQCQECQVTFKWVYCFQVLSSFKKAKLRSFPDFSRMSCVKCSLFVFFLRYSSEWGISLTTRQTQVIKLTHSGKKFLNFIFKK